MMGIVVWLLLRCTYRNCLSARTILSKFYALAFFNLLPSICFISSGILLIVALCTTLFIHVTVRVSFSQLSLVDVWVYRLQVFRQTNVERYYDWLNMNGQPLTSIQVMLAPFCPPACFLMISSFQISLSMIVQDCFLRQKNVPQHYSYAFRVRCLPRNCCHINLSQYIF